MSFNHEKLSREILDSLERRRAASGKAPLSNPAQATPTPAAVKKPPSQIERGMRAALKALQEL